jgi:hypothetical protein
VNQVHFNASGESKRREMDRHETCVKACCKEAMAAGQPPACTTPALEVEARCFQGGCPGSSPVLLDFDHESEAKVDSWDGIQSFHGFKIEDNGDITA